MNGMERKKGMQLRDVLKLARSDLRRSFTRTLLTVLGTVIGTACITLMLSVGWSGYSALASRIASSDSLTLIEVWPDPARAAEITEQTVAVFAALSHVEAASQVIELPAQLEAGPYEASVPLRGVDPAVLNLRFAQGGAFGAGSRMEIVLGAGALRNFVDPKRPPDFSDWESYASYRPDVDWLEETVTLQPGYTGMDVPARSYRVRVCGVTEDGEDGSSDPYVYMPLASVREILRENRAAAAEMGLQPDSGSLALVRTEDMEFTEDVMEQITQMGFDAQSEISYIRAMNEERDRQQVQLLAIGLISLAVSAVGMANTMYASVLERRRDVGIMKVLGTSPGEIRRLFLAEAVIIGAGGGLLGLGVSLVALLFLNVSLAGGSFLGVWLESGSAVEVPLPVALFAVSVAVATSVLAGVYPAAKAARMSPLEAMRSQA